jgi:hypothetical protein
MSTFDEQAAGFFAAEGHFRRQVEQNCNGDVGGRSRLSVGQKEKYWLALLREHYGVGHVYSKKSTSAWEWNVNATMAESLYAHFVEQPVTWRWVVGFWEGDGSIGANNHRFSTPMVFFWNNDYDLLETVRGVLGALHQPYRGNGPYQLIVCGELARELVPRLAEDVFSPRRREQLRPYVEAVQVRRESIPVRRLTCE